MSFAKPTVMLVGAASEAGELHVFDAATGRLEHTLRVAEGKRKAALAVAAKEKEEAVRKARYEMFGLTYSSVPPLPDGATDADLERLEDEDLEAMYGR